MTKKKTKATQGDIWSGAVVFCDGASSGNPGPGGWGTIVYTPDGMIRELGGRAAETTNNKMELLGAIEGLRELRDFDGDVTIATDSTYVIRGITQWIWAWRSRDWKTAEGADVANREFWEELSRLVSARKKKGGTLEWRYVRGHQGTPGNERVDAIAVAFSKGKWVDLYEGPLLKYEYAITDLPENMELPEMRPREAPGDPSQKKPVWYLSLVNDQLEKHTDWKSCEARVKGRPGAKFKKVSSPEEEAAVLKGWGV
ncbi:MAG: ribonuclease HI [Bdellovibrionales bacterium]|nr:ribonuclease HI [Bdellovibrionales bacterium]